MKLKSVRSNPKEYGWTDHNKPLRTDHRQVSNIRHTLVGTKIVDHSDVVGSAPVQLHLHSTLNTWFQYIEQRQLQAKPRNILVFGFGASYNRDFTQYKGSNTKTQ